MTETAKIKQAQSNLETTQKELEYMTTGLEKAKAEITRLEWQIKQLEAETPELAAKIILGEIKQETLEKHLDNMSDLKQQAAIYKAALPILGSWLEQARADRNKANDDLRKEKNWQWFEELKDQLLEKFDEKILLEARMSVHAIGRQGPAVHAYGILVDKLRKLNPRRISNINVNQPSNRCQVWQN
ncbi:hypothetical protein [uncultured Desulfobacter sp.]|uniref:hypothetical protein n=1 Tax=uncultured Desulfobacter sp. TaxID=240139 RepID=UPI002AAC1E82|nr:hypothetical protein [uncultured Desulfobacter sp.]